MKKFGLTLLALLASGGLGLTIVAARYQEVYAPGTRVGSVDLSGLSPVEADQRLHQWWTARQMDLLNLSSAKLVRTLPPLSPMDAGLVLDVKATLAQLKTEPFSNVASRTIGMQSPATQGAQFVWKFDDARLEKLATFVEKSRPAIRPAKVEFVKGAVKRTPEVAGLVLDAEKVRDTILNATLGDGTAELPLVEGPKKLADTELAKIKEVIGTFTTHFPSYQTARNTNIRLASKKIDGLILMPGDTFSFNETVGPRTSKLGYREAPVLVNGRHDTGIGGGCCQVSTTLYNAALLADLKIVERRNHSLASAYVSLGRDATVSWGTQDFKFKNSLEIPIAIALSLNKGSITFHILGTKVPGQKVRIESGKTSYGGQSVKFVKDPRLTVGRSRVLEKGGTRRSISTYRLVYQDGKLVKRESLGTSFYPGGTTVIARGTKPRSAPQPTTTPGSIAPAVTPGNTPNQ